jgi:hypothetical protein
VKRPSRYNFARRSVDAVDDMVGNPSKGSPAP